jgi:hypothetical protein
MEFMIKHVKAFAISHPALFIFELAFFYVLIAGFFIQFIFLPYLAPANLSQGDGLLSGYDGYKFHRIAVNLSQEIKANGWSEWYLWPEGQIVSGIASVFYTLITPKPWVLLPLNGILHGIAGLALWGIISTICKNKSLILISSLPFILFPSSLLWNAQIHNENYAIPAILLFFYGWIYLSDVKRGLELKKSWKAFVCIFLGSLMNFMVRDYIQSILSWIALLVFFLLVISTFIQLIKKEILIKKGFSYIVFIGLVWILSNPGLFKWVDTNITHYKNDNIASDTLNLDAGTLNTSWTQDNQVQADKYTTWWMKSKILPQAIDSKFMDLAKMRLRFIRSWNYAGSQIDSNVIFRKSTDVIEYMPRALIISLFAPFPEDWFTNGYKKAANLMRKESSFEMMICYVCLLGLFFSGWYFRKRIEFWVLLAFAVGMLTIYTCTIPNIGALYRFRYPYYMPLICVGLLGLMMFIKKIIFRSEKAER